MLNNVFIRLLQLVALGVIQVLLFNHIHFMGYGIPLVYVAFLLYFPANADKSATLVWAFLLGVLMDMFTNTAGLSAASMTLAAIVQPFMLKSSLPKDSLEDMVPTYRSMGAWNQLRYITVLLLVHHVAYFCLESFSFFNLATLGISAATSFASSWTVIVLLETLRGKKQHA